MHQKRNNSCLFDRYPKTLKFGFMLEVVFTPRLMVNRMWQLSRIPLAARVAKMARSISAYVLR